jgi:hypothetical protein
MDEATYLVAQQLVELMESDPNAKNDSVKYSDWFNGMIDHLIDIERSV